MYAPGVFVQHRRRLLWYRLDYPILGGYCVRCLVCVNWVTGDEILPFGWIVISQYADPAIVGVPFERYRVVRQFWFFHVISLVVGLQASAFREADITLTNDDVVEYSDIEKPQYLNQFIGDHEVRIARFGYP